MWSFSIGFVHIKPLLFSLFLNRWLKSSTENVFFFLTSPSLVSPTNILQSSELYGQVRSGFLFSSIKGKLRRIDDIPDVFAKDAFSLRHKKIEFTNRNRRRFFFVVLLAIVSSSGSIVFSGVQLILIGFEASPSIATSIILILILILIIDS